MGDRKIIVYHSRGEQAMDEWLYEDGGMLYVAGFLLVFVIVALIANAISERRRFRF
jgi:hypothetical protein